MKYQTLGRSGLKVSALTLGTMTFGGEGAMAKVGDTDVQDAREMIEGVIELGDADVSKIMTPRTDMQMVQVDAPWGEVVAAVIEDPVTAWQQIREFVVEHSGMSGFLQAVKRPMYGFV